MATSESDGFESADDEINHDTVARRNFQTQQWCTSAGIDSESDDDAEYVPRTPCPKVYNKRVEKPAKKRSMTDEEESEEVNKNTDTKLNDRYCNEQNDEQISRTNVAQTSERVNEEVTATDLQTETVDQANTSEIDSERKGNNTNTSFGKDVSKKQLEKKIGKSDEKVGNQKKSNVKKLGTKLTQSNNFVDDEDCAKENIKTDFSVETKQVFTNESSLMDEMAECEMPEEMKSDKKFKEVFKTEGWEGLGNEIELPEELTEEKLQPILKRLSLAGQDSENSGGWGWGNWGVSSLINTATVGVSTLTSHVTHGLTLLEESMNITEESKSPTEELEENLISNDDKTVSQAETPTSSFGFGNIISGVSSITKLVESTGTKVMSGGLDTLEAIGKKTMEVLQEGDQGLIKKRAFFMNETDKPILSDVLQEAKEKATTVEKSIEEKKKMKKVHFENLFDDYKGLVHLEALEILSKQSDIKIERHLINLDTNELKSIQEILEEIKEICDLGDDEDEDNMNECDLENFYESASTEFGFPVNFNNLIKSCQEAKTFATIPTTHTPQEIFEHAIPLIAQVTVCCIESFHKIAELLLLKEHRNTVSEADTAVHLTRIFLKQIGVLANMYCTSLNSLAEGKNKEDTINTHITTIFMVASNASSYIQDALKLLIPIIQVGAI